MTARCGERMATGVALARRELAHLAARLDLVVPAEARIGADLAARTRRRLPWPPPAPLLRAADGWVHPGPETTRPAFLDMVEALGAPPPAPGERWPRLDMLAVDRIDAEAAAWLLPAAAVRVRASSPDPVPELRMTTVIGATVVVLGTAWATPLVGAVLARRGARVLKVEHPRRPDPFPLRADLVARQDVIGLDLDVERDRVRFAALVDAADLLVVGHPPRVLANAGIVAPCPTIQVAAFADRDGPGYGPAAEGHGGWAARHDPPRLGRTSLADPVAGLVAAIAAVHALTTGSQPSVRVSLEGAVGRLLEREHRGG
jgi:hypothetical protein